MRKKEINRTLVLLSLTCMGLWLLKYIGVGEWTGPSQPAVPVQKTDNKGSASASLSFRDWLSAWDERDLSADPNLTEQGVELARLRQVEMRQLIQTDPTRALKKALGISEWLSLPEAVRSLVEQPVSCVTDLNVYIACGDNGLSSVDRIAEWSKGERFSAYAAGAGRLARTKDGIPVQGIRLGDIGALRDSVFQILVGEDEAAASTLFQVFNRGRCLVTGEPLTERAVAALSAGKVFYFKDHSTLEQLEERLQEFDKLPGPDCGSMTYVSALMDHFDGLGVDLDEVESRIYAASDAWTGSPRDMYVILVDFSDKPGQPTDPATLEQVINTTVSQQIQEMSFGKSHIVCTVNTNTYRMPDPSTVYASEHRTMVDEAKALVEADGIDLTPYETICIYFTTIPGLTLRGYANLGGPGLWLHNTSSPFVIVHELGHNYGSFHAHTWNVTGTDPVDPAGEHEEYGDILDIMGQGTLPQGHFHIQNKLQVHWLNASNIVTVTNSGTYRVHRADHGLSNPDSALGRGLRMHKDSTNFYWVGYRQLYPEYDRLSRGTYVLWQQPNAEGYPKSHLLDMSPGSVAGKLDAGLALGQTYSDPGAQVHITPVHRGGSAPDEWMEVHVEIGSPPSNIPPLAEMSGPTNGATQESLIFTVAAHDPNGDELAYFWDFEDGLVHDNINQAAQAWSVPGTQTVRCIVSDMKGGCVTNETSVVISQDLSWPDRQNITSSYLYDIATDGTRLVTVGQYGFIAISTNGTDWVTGNVGANASSMFLQGIIHDGIQFIVVGADTSDWTGVVYTSTDGLTWTLRYSKSSPGLSDIAIKGNKRIAVGSQGTVLLSSNGYFWNKQTGTGVTNDLRGVSNNGTFFCAVGLLPGGAGASKVYISLDGVNWTDRSAFTDTGPGQILSDVQACNGILLAGGFSTGIHYSSDGGQYVAEVYDDSLFIPAFAYGNGIYLAAGRYHGSGTADVNLLSTDGITWNAIPTEPQFDRNAAIFYDNCFITVGQSGSIWRSAPLNTADDGWALWQTHYRELLGPNRGAFDDPDQDGMQNLLEYALGTDPADADSKPDHAFDAESGGYLMLSTERNHKPDDIDYRVERTDDLMDAGAWSTNGTVMLEDTSTNLTVRSAHPISAQTNEYLRLKIELNGSSR